MRAATVPNSTLAPVRSVPVIVTVVPPAAGPVLGKTLVTIGAAHVGEPISTAGHRSATRRGHPHIHRSTSRRADSRDLRIAIHG